MTAQIQYPNRYQIEVFAGCNLRCPLCHAGRREIRRKNWSINLRQFERIFDLIEPHVEVLYLHMWGEPTLNKDLIGMIELVSRRKPSCVTNVSTNGNGLFREYAYAMVRSGLRQLIVSLDGWDQESYAKYRQGGDFQDALAFLQYCAQAKTELGSNICIIAQCLEMSHTADSHIRFKEVAGLAGVDLAFKPLYISGYGEDGKHLIADEAHNQMPTLATCDSLSNAFFVQSDGEVIPCCLYSEPSRTRSLGNIFEASSLEELLASPDRVAMREMIRAGRPPTATCARLCAVPPPPRACS